MTTFEDNFDRFFMLLELLHSLLRVAIQVMLNFDCDLCYSLFQLLNQKIDWWVGFVHNCVKRVMKGLCNVICFCHVELYVVVDRPERSLVPFLRPFVCSHILSPEKVEQFKHSRIRLAILMNLLNKCIEASSNLLCRQKRQCHECSHASVHNIFTCRVCPVNLVQFQLLDAFHDVLVQVEVASAVLDLWEELFDGIRDGDFKITEVVTEIYCHVSLICFFYHQLEKTLVVALRFAAEESENQRIERIRVARQGAMYGVELFIQLLRDDIECGVRLDQRRTAEVGEKSDCRY